MYEIGVPCFYGGDRYLRLVGSEFGPVPEQNSDIFKVMTPSNPQIFIASLRNGGIIYIYIASDNLFSVRIAGHCIL